MSRKIRVPKGQIAALPSPAWTFFLLTGQTSAPRLPGWVGHLQAGQFGEPTAEQVWATHGPALLEEAAAFGFQPWGATRRRPHGPAVEQWSTQFLAQHIY